MILTADVSTRSFGVADAAMLHTAEAYQAPAAHIPAANAAWAGFAVAPQRKRRPAVATAAFVDRGSP